MTKRLIIILALLLLSMGIYAQVDDIELQINQYENTKAATISKGRNLLLDKFLANDLKTVKEVKDYLMITEDDYYFAFYPFEYWLILYWTKDYEELACSIQQFDTTKLKSFQRRIRPIDDILYPKLFEKSLIAKDQLKNQILDSKIDLETKQFLDIFLFFILADKKQNVFIQDTINDNVDKFLITYPQTKYADFAKTHIRYKLVPKNWGVACEFFFGYDMFTGNLCDNFKNAPSLGFAFDIYYKNFEIYLRDFIGSNKTNKDINYSVGTFEKGSRLSMIIAEASLGYVVYNDDRFKLSPFGGIGYIGLSPSADDVKKIPQLEEIEYNNSTYILGVNCDIKFGRKNVPKYNPKATYSFIRIRYAYCFPNFEKKYVGMTGNMHYITVGYGLGGKGLKREY